jgi:Zn-finger nucleic acid-binding protein
VDIWGWIIPVANLCGKAATNWARRGRLRKMLENPRYPQGRNLAALRRAVGEADTDAGRERTRELLRGVKRRAKKARQLKRTNPQASEMWGLRSED